MADASRGMNRARLMGRLLAAALLTLLLLAGAASPAAFGAAIQRPWSEDVVYLIMTDRFANGDRSNDQDVDLNTPHAFHGGDLQGVIDKLDYLQGLGVTAIWLTPVVQNPSNGYHGYWAVDFYKVDPHLGSMESLQRLVAEAHKREMKVMLDVVVNHVSPVHPWVNEPGKADWFHQNPSIKNYDNQQEAENYRLAGLPDLAQENPAVKQYLLDMSTWWIDQTGVDGFRLDTVRHVPTWFWTEYSEALHAHKPGFFLMGEAWHGDLDYLKGYLGTGLDSLVDFARYYKLQEVFARGQNPSQLHATTLRQMEETPDKIWATFIDNHDVPRFVTGAAPGGTNKQRLALAYALTAPGMPILYYGTEVPIEGGDDPDNRKEMKWEKEPALKGFIAELTRIRREQKAFTAGDYQPVTGNAKVVSFVRELEGRRYLVALNNSATEQQLPLAEVLGPKGRLSGLLAAEAMPVRLDSAGNLTLPPWGVGIYAIEQGLALSGGLLTTMGLGSGLLLLALFWVIARRRRTAG